MFLTAPAPDKNFGSLRLRLCSTGFNLVLLPVPVPVPVPYLPIINEVLTRTGMLANEKQNYYNCDRQTGKIRKDTVRCT